MTYRTYARHRGVSLQTIQHHIRRGRIPVRRDGLIDSEVADRARGGADDAIQNALAIRLTFQARMLELEFERRSRELLPRADVERATSAAVLRVRAVVAEMGERLGPRVVGVPVHEAIKAINDEAASVLEELAAPSARSTTERRKRCRQGGP